MRKFREWIANFSSQISKIILFASSYIPLLVIIILQLIQALISESKGFEYTKIIDWWNLISDTNNSIVISIWVLMVMTIGLCWLLKQMLNHSSDENLEHDLDIVNVQNINAQYITNYFTVYIFPFITLSFITFSGVGTLLILLIVIGYVYIKNDLLYINPILNIFFKFSVFTLETTEGDTTIEVILLSKKNRTELKRLDEISAQKIGDNVYIELSAK